MDITKIIIYIAICLIGMVVFSFANVVIYRLPKKEQVFKGKSKCMSCGHELSFKDSIPVFSWLTLGGKCRYCKNKITARYLFVELLGGIFAVGLAYYYGMNLKALTIFLFFTVLTIITFIDHDTMEIPPVLNLTILILGVAAIWTVGYVSIVERIIGFFCISLPLYLIVLIIPDGFGGGDIKLMAAAGFFLGWKATVVGFMIGLVAGALYGIVLLARRKKGKNDHFAFGPFLSFGLMLSTLWGMQLATWYIDYVKSMFSQGY